MIWSFVKAMYELVFAGLPKANAQSIGRVAGEGGWGDEDADHLKKK